MRLAIFVIGMLLIGCGNTDAPTPTTQQAEATQIATEVQSKPVKEEEPTGFNEKSFHEHRFADFSCCITNYYFNDHFLTWIKFTPSRQGAYYIEGWEHAEKVISGPEPQEILLKFWGNGWINVTFSDGKSIERTYMQTPTR